MSIKNRAWIELNIDNLAYNLAQIKKILPPTCEVMPAVKANAYGHGAVLISKALQDMEIKNYCVATVNEAVTLRRAGIRGQILILGYTSPKEFPALTHYALTQTAIDYSYARQLNDFGQTMLVHVGIDTGMHRLGERSKDIESIFKIWELANLKITGLYSHLCVADGNTDFEKEFTLKQIADFYTVIDLLHKRGIKNFKTHLQGSYGILNYPALKFDYARLGIALYGVLSTSYDKTVSDINLRPVLSLKARIACIKKLHTGETLGYGLNFRAKKEMKIATLSIGYADGIPRELSNKGAALIDGKRAPMIGRICMDQLMIDVTEIPSLSPGYEVLLIGKSGKQEIPATDLASSINTISNEILSRLGNRLEKIAIKKNKASFLKQKPQYPN